MENEIEEGEAEKAVDAPTRFVQIVTAVSNAYGRADGEVLSSDNLYALDDKGRVWTWVYCDPDRKGAADGWEPLPSAVYQDGEDPPAPKKTR